MNYLAVPNLERWQHYKDRCPPWMKLHRDLLRDYEFGQYTDAQKYHLLGIWLLATQLDNKIPDDPEWLKVQIGAKSRIDIQLYLRHNDLVQHASNMLAECKQDAIGETETETETENYIRGSAPTVPYGEIKNLYEKLLPNNPRIVNLSNSRKANIRARWNNGIPDLDSWEQYFKHIAQSKFLTGRCQPSRGRTKPFVADIDFLTSEQNMLKIVEGKYHE